MCHFLRPPIVNLPLNADGVLPLWGWPWLTASLIDTKVMQEKFVLHDTECFGKATMCAICGIIAFMIMIWQLVNGDTWTFTYPLAMCRLPKSNLFFIFFFTPPATGHKPSSTKLCGLCETRLSTYHLSYQF